MQRKFRLGGTVFCVWLMALTFQVLGNSGLQAQDFPNKPINLIIPSAAGGTSDLTARTFVHLSSEILGQPMVVQIRPGGAGAIGTELVAQAKPDGYTLAMAHTNFNSVLPAVDGRSRGPDELDAVSLINVMNFIYYVRSDSPFKTMKDVIDYAKANPDKLTYGNSGTWSLSDLEWRMFEVKAGIKTRNIPQEGGGAALIALLGGHVQIAMIGPPQSLPHYRAGKLRPVAIQGSKRLAALPDVPTLKEQGYDIGIEGAWMGVAAPKGTPRPVIEKLAGFFKRATENKQAIESYAKLACEFNYLGPDEFAAYWRKDYQVYKEMAKLFKK